MVTQLAPVRASAIDRALERAQAEGTQAVYSIGGVWLASSTSRPGHWHRVNPDLGTCDCEAGRRHLVCKHLALVWHLQAQPCDLCGHTGDTIREYVRIHSECYRWQNRCRNVVACGQFADRRRGLVVMLGVR